MRNVDFNSICIGLYFSKSAHSKSKWGFLGQNQHNTTAFAAQVAWGQFPAFLGISISFRRCVMTLAMQAFDRNAGYC